MNIYIVRAIVFLLHSKSIRLASTKMTWISFLLIRTNLIIIIIIIITRLGLLTARIPGNPLQVTA